ncbi:Regulator of chromosome condensation (RCC1) repeat [Phytophthora infestans]|uniref:Regulator of chromosome condensation (RCC1) repeat n=1 Tax=Phytophthora infestans TaxID=4787 RepID=A0A8S9V4J8_PHYIN|nr:Regulator of chromosome condensation (RCC1) repeat [Phytophthora infestans]
MVQVLLGALRAAGRRASAARLLATRSVLRTASFATQSSVYTWGNGTLGQLGHGSVIKSGIRSAYEELTPKLTEALEGKAITHVEFGASHSAAIDEEGKLYVWGSNEYSKLGLGESSEMETLPREVEALKGIKIVDVSCGDYFTAAVDEDGKMYSWGWGGSTMKGAGGLGHAGGKDEPTPRLLTTLVDQGVPIATVECGEFHTVALTKDGEIWAWGNGEYGRLGNGESDTCEVPEPIEFFSKDNVVSIAAGRDFSFALTDKGELYSWGGNSQNQLGIGGGLAMDVYNIESIPVLVEAFNGLLVKQIAAGYDHAAAVTEDGRLYMWGAKIWIEPHEMTAVNEHKMTQVACGRQYTVGLTDDGKVFTFGKGSSNCLGHGDRKNQLQPVKIQALAGVNITSVSCGDYHMGAIATPHAEAADRDFSFRE